MLLEFSFSNHKSIWEKVVFSTLAGKDTSHENNLIRFEKFNVLKTSVMYGANGSGKSNFIDALSFVEYLVTNSINFQPGMKIPQKPFKLSSSNAESVFRILFVAGGIRYAYQFSLKDMIVEDEYLYYYPNGRRAAIYERHGESFTEGRNFKGRFDRCRDVLKSNRLMLSCAANFSNVKETEDAFLFFNKSLVIYDSRNQDNWLNYSLHAIADNDKMRHLVIGFMQRLGIEVKDIAVSLDRSVDKVSAQVLYKDFQTDLLSEESNGIKKLFAFLCPFLDIINTGKVLVCDELEAGLHESLVYGLVKMFMSPKICSNAQLIFTTHDTSLLNPELFRRDQIWFTELKENRSTDIYSLAEVKNVRRDENFAKGYINGRYGAIPMLNQEFVDSFMEGQND